MINNIVASRIIRKGYEATYLLDDKEHILKIVARNIDTAQETLEALLSPKPFELLSIKETGPCYVETITE